MRPTLVQRYHRWDDRAEPVLLWFATVDLARTWAEANVDRDHSTEVLELARGGGVEVLHSFRWQPAPYRGPIARARISLPLNGDDRFGALHAFVHRCPVDCSVPRPDLELGEQTLVRVVRNEFGGSYDECSTEARRRVAGTGVDPLGDGFFQCLCGSWQDIEGEPAAVLELADKYPPRPGTPDRSDAT